VRFFPYCSAPILVLAVLLAGCQSIDGPSPVLIPNNEQVVSRSLQIPAEGLVLGALVWIVVDPLAPNWAIEQVPLGPDRYAFALKKKRFTTGGDGEAEQVFRRRVAALARERGYRDYEILEYSSGIESNVPIAQRVAHGIVQYR
jgi:hypothetical protein